MNRQAITKPFARRALRRSSAWDVGNATLYALCRKYPEHHRIDEIAAKVWLIGRSYAASIERGRGPASDDDEDFYVDTVAPKIRSARIDRWLEPLRGMKRPEAAVAVPAHKRLTDLFREISDKERRSLASKYLHFHFPKAVYIFDERASRGIRLVSSAQHLRELPFKECDDTYARFYLRVAEFHRQLNVLMGRPLSPREVDSVLLEVADRG